MVGIPSSIDLMRFPASEIILCSGRVATTAIVRIWALENRAAVEAVHWFSQGTLIRYRRAASPGQEPHSEEISRGIFYTEEAPTI